MHTMQVVPQRRRLQIQVNLLHAHHAGGDTAQAAADPGQPRCMHAMQVVPQRKRLQIQVNLLHAHHAGGDTAQAAADPGQPAAATRRRSGGIAGAAGTAGGACVQCGAACPSDGHALPACSNRLVGVQLLMPLGDRACISVFVTRSLLFAWPFYTCMGTVHLRLVQAVHTPARCTA